MTVQDRLAQWAPLINNQRIKECLEVERDKGPAASPVLWQG
jgi:hypothetical protein